MKRREEHLLAFAGCLIMAGGVFVAVWAVSSSHEYLDPWFVTGFFLTMLGLALVVLAYLLARPSRRGVRRDATRDGVAPGLPPPPRPPVEPVLAPTLPRVSGWGFTPSHRPVGHGGGGVRGVEFSLEFPNNFLGASISCFVAGPGDIAREARVSVATSVVRSDGEGSLRATARYPLDFPRGTPGVRPGPHNVVWILTPLGDSDSKMRYEYETDVPASWFKQLGNG